MTEYAALVILAPVSIDKLFQHNVVAGQCPGLIGAKNVHRPEILDGVEVLDNGLFLSHRDSSFAQVSGDNHRKHLRSQSHGYGNGKNKGFEPVAFRHSVDKKHQRHHHQHETDQQKTDIADSFIECRLRTYADDTPGDGAQIGISPCTENNGTCRTAHYIGAHEANVIKLDHTAGTVTILRQYGTLLYGIGFSGQRGLADEQVFRLDDADIGRNHISGSQTDDVSRHQVCNVDLVRLRGTATNDGCGIFHHLLQSIRSPAGTPLLREAQHDTKHHHTSDDKDTGPLPFFGPGHPDVEHQRHKHKCHQYTDKGVDKGFAKHQKRIGVCLLHDFILTAAFKPLFRILLRESVGGSTKIAIHQLQRLGCCQKYLLGIELHSLVCLFLSKNHHSTFFLEIRGRSLLEESHSFAFTVQR